MYIFSFNIFYCYSITVVPIFPPSASSTTQPTRHSQSQSAQLSMSLGRVYLLFD